MVLLPHDRRALLPATADADAAIQAINVVNLGHYLLKPENGGQEPELEDRKLPRLSRRRQRYAARGSCSPARTCWPARKRPTGWTLDRDPYHLEGRVPAIFAARDVRANSVKRVACAVGEGAMAIKLVHRYLEA